MAATMTLDEARKILKAFNYAKAEGFTVKKAQQKIDEILEDPESFEGDAKKVKGKEEKKLVDLIWDAVDDEDEIEVVEEEEEEEEDEDEEEEDDDDDDEPAKKSGKKGAKASKNGKPSKKEKSSGAVERDEFGRSVNSQAHRINEAITKEGQTAAEIAEECDAPVTSVTTHLRNLVQQEYINCKKVGNVIQFFRKGGKPTARDDDDEDEKPRKKKVSKAEKNGKADKKGGKTKPGKKKVGKK